MSCTFIPKFDVFLSFSGEEITKTFVKDLNRSLSEKGVTTYQKDDKLEDKISPHGSDLTKCITESKLVVVVISRSYPTSILCLNHLETIIKSHDQGRFPVLPIFYGVNPSNVRKQSGEVEEPFRKLCEEYPADKVQTWRTALTKLTNISSLESRYWNIEAKAIEFITKEILHLISKKPKAIKDDGLVALDRHMQALYKLVDLQSQEEVRLIGIWGLRGVGKTTLARYAYEELSTNFHAHMFIDDAQNLSYDVIKSTVGHRKGLLVIDCVEDVKQLKSITDIVGWCGPGSRVILVTEEKSLIEEFGVKHVYQVKSLRYHEALQLFSQSAFNKKNPPASFASLSFRAVQVADFLPLTLKILGSSLQGKNHLTWERELKKLEGDQEKAITKALDVNKDVALKPPKPSAFPISPTSRPYVTSSQLSSQAARRLTTSQISSRLMSSQTSSQLSDQVASWLQTRNPTTGQSFLSDRRDRHPMTGDCFPTSPYTAGQAFLFDRYRRQTIGRIFPSVPSAGSSAAGQAFLFDRYRRQTIGRIFPSVPSARSSAAEQHRTVDQRQTIGSLTTDWHLPSDEHPTTDTVFFLDCFFP